MQQKGSTVKQISLLFTISFFAAIPFAMLHTGETDLIKDYINILVSPCPLITDYFVIGSLPATLLNAGLCGLLCTALLYIFDKGAYTATNLAGFFLVIAHCFYGLTLVNMILPMMGIFFYCQVTKQSISEELDIAMFSTSFGPFISELLFRYPFSKQLVFMIGKQAVSITGLLSAILIAILLGFAIPAMLPGAKLLHKGFNLYNGGLACGLLGMFLFAFMYKTMGLPEPQSIKGSKTVDYRLFSNTFFIIVFLICLIKGWLMNGKTFKGYGQIIDESGHNVDFLSKYDPALTWLNMGIYGLFIVACFDVIVVIFDGVSWTGPTFGVTIAAITFAAAGQHPRNVFPIFIGYAVLYFLVNSICAIYGRPMMWSLATQGYICALAFATGLCPFSGVHGIIGGILAGMISAILCPNTVTMHGGLMLYNGGLNAGITAIILTPILALYEKHKK